MKVFGWLLIIAITVIVVLHFQAVPDNLSLWDDPGTYRSKIIQISNVQNDHFIRQVLIARFSNGPYRGKTVQLTNVYAVQAMEFLYQRGDWIFIKENKNNVNLRFYIFGPDVIKVY